MRRFLIIASLSVACLGANAQELPEQTVAPIWHFTEMNGNAAVVIFKKDSARVQKDTALLTFAIQPERNAVRLKNKTNDAQALQLLGLTAEAVNIQYGPDKLDLLPTEKLLTAAQQLPDKKLLLEGNPANNPAFTATDSANEPELAPEEPVANTMGTLDTNNPWLYAAGALVLGFILGWLVKPRKKVVAPQGEVMAPETSSVVVADPAQQAQIKQLQEQLKLGQAELSRVQAEDQQYFKALFEQLLLPMQESLEENKKSHLLAQMTTASVLLNSLTRHKLGKKGKYEEANLNLLTGVAGSGNDAPVITGATPPDQIPHHLRALIELLRENNISSLGDLVVQGYRIRDL